MSEISKEQINAFLSGSDPMEHIIKIECDYDSEEVFIIYRDDNGEKKIKKEYFFPFIWCKKTAAISLYGGDRIKIINEMNRRGISVKALRVEDSNGNVPNRMENGFRLLFFATVPMSYQKFLSFFEDAGKPIYTKNKENSQDKEFMMVSPVEQYMISTGRRLFKGYDDYDDLVRMQWDLETEGLNPNVNAIRQIGIRTNKGFEKIITIEGNDEEKITNEILAIREFLHIIKEISPDIISGHNTENFDWNFINVRLGLQGSSLKDFSQGILPRGVYKKKKQAVLKLGGEIEYYFPTVMWGYNLTDSLFAVRRAQALDSNMKKADLKYVTKYSKLVKPNRVYVPGKLINKTWEDNTPIYAFNDANGNWFKLTNELLAKAFTDDNEIITQRYVKSDDGKTLIDSKTKEEFQFVTGKYIVERYLLDDLYETDKVEARYNQSNYLVGKMLPVSYEKMCTMGTAAIWKYIMMAWSYEHDLAIPDLIQTKPFTGGLSRLLSVGYAANVVKLDYNSLYPSIILTFNIKSDIDIQGVMNALLEYILSQRELYKGLKAEEGAKAKKAENEKEKLRHEALAAKYDKMQLPLKITGNAFFGSYGSGSVFPWSDITCAEETTCTGRMMLRLMIKHFTELGYEPIVGDSFTNDTPVFIKYNDNSLIDIVPIESIFNEKSVNIDTFKREYDISKKDFKVLCKSGWIEPLYIYRHKTNKDIYRIIDGTATVDITKDHSVYDCNGYKLSPHDIKETTKLEYFNDNINSNFYDASFIIGKIINDFIKNRIVHKLPIELINADTESKLLFIDTIAPLLNKTKYNKVINAGIYYIKRCINR